MKWIAVIPLKQGSERKTRLAARLSPEDRAELSDRMAARVIAALADAGLAARLLSPAARPGQLWEPDRGMGLNAEFDRLRAEAIPAPFLVVHADLPLLDRNDISELLAAAEAAGAAIAPDRHGVGTNAVALADARPFTFSFGTESFARHRAALPDGAVIRRPGLALDVDEPDDLDEAVRCGAAFADLSFGRCTERPPSIGSARTGRVR